MSEAEDEAADDFEVLPTEQHAWAKSGERYWTPTSTATRLPSGVYKVGLSTRLGPYLDRVSVVKDNLIVLPGMGAETVLTEIKEFWDRRARYREKGVVHKRGILMEGPPGSGKTSNSELIIELFIKEVGGIVMLGNDTGHVAVGMQLIRKREPERPVLVVIEDIDAVARSNEEGLLNLLDGKEQFDGVVFVATTNYLERLPDRIANRPSRFDLVVKIGLPGWEARVAFIKAREPKITAAVAEEIAGATDGYSIAHLKELLILTEVYEMPLAAAHTRIKAIMDRKLLPEQASLKTGSVTPLRKIA